MGVREVLSAGGRGEGEEGGCGEAPDVGGLLRGTLTSTIPVEEEEGREGKEEREAREGGRSFKLIVHHGQTITRSLPPTPPFSSRPSAGHTREWTGQATAGPVLS